MTAVVDPLVPEPGPQPSPAGGGTDGGAPGPVAGGWQARWRRGLRPWRRAGRTARVLVALGLCITAAFAMLALFGDRLAPYDEDQYRFETGAVVDGQPEFESIPRRAGPDGDHPMGTTVARFDVFSRVIIGARLAMGVVVLSTVLAMVIGVPLGLLSGYVGGRIDRVLVLTFDAVYAFPALLLSIIVAFMLKEYLDPGLPAAAVAVGVVYVPQYFRVIRNHTLSVKQEPFVEAARSLGAKPRTVVGRYVFFNVVQSVPVIFTLNAADAVLTLAGLGFLGYGVAYPAAEWGLDVSRAITDTVSGTWWTAFWPGVAIMALVTGLTLLGEGLNDIINPLLRVKGYRGKVPSARGGGGPGRVGDDRRSRPTRRGQRRVTEPDEGPVLELLGLRVAYATERGMLGAVDGIDLTVAPGESVGVVGESGCGKSTMGRALLGLLPAGATTSGRVRLQGEELLGSGATGMEAARGGRIGLVFQEPMTRLDPLMRVIDHFVEALRAHHPGLSKAAAAERGRRALVSVGIPPTRSGNHPHEFSGGMRQRIMIALTLALEPAVIIADEPTTALDVVVEAQVLDLLDGLRRDHRLGLVLITHNLGIVAETCDRVAVMYAGRIVEEGPVADVFADPKHPYTRGLLASVISIDTTELHSIGGSPPDLVDPPPGCRFRPRCPEAFSACPTIDPPPFPVGPGRRAACLLYAPTSPVPAKAEW